MSEGEVEKLAESLKNSGLAASMTDAIDKAESILGHSNKGVKIRVEEPKAEQKEKVDEIIKEVDDEIEQSRQGKEKTVETQPEEPKDETLSKFDDPSFNAADSDMTTNEITSGEVMTNDPEVLSKEKEAEKFEENPSETADAGDEVQADAPETPKGSMVMTNDETEQQEDSEDEEIKREEEEGESTEEEKKEEKPELSDEEKEKTDLTKLFNVNK